MKVTFESEDQKEIMRLTKSLDMASVLFELSHNTWRKFEDLDVDHSPVFENINKLFEDYGINVDELIE